MENKFKIYICPVYFAPILSEFKDNKPVHCLAYSKCNYRCDFCDFDTRTVERYPEYTLETFEQTVWKLLRVSKNFKFTGGEPTLNPLLPELLRIVKIYGAMTYLDTNGSRPDKIKDLLDENLVDILGISLKGLSADEAANTARITNTKLCWDNVFESIRLGCENNNVRVILTYVACDGHFNDDSLDLLADKLSAFPNVTLKINNCYNVELIKGRRKGFVKDEIYDMVERFVERHPEFKGRTVLFSDHDSCVDQNKIITF